MTEAGSTLLACPPLLADRYEPQGLLGTGAHAQVALAWDHRHRRKVVLKIRLAGAQEALEAQLAETRLLLSLRPHPGLPAVREDFFDDDRYVIVSDWVEGTSLAGVLAERGDPGLPVGSVLGWLTEAAEALEHLHRHDPPIVHGDVKPANLVLTPEDRVVLVDLGSDAGRAPASRGTPGYVAPEVTAGAAPTPAADVYGLAATAVALLTGSAPSGRRATWEWVPPATAAALDRSLRRALGVDPLRRPASSRLLMERLRSVFEAALPSGIVTFCLTDVEGSTPLWDAHPEAMAEALALHDAIVAEAVDDHTGHLIKAQGEGDSTLSVFARASDAVRCAVALHQSLTAAEWPDDVRLSVRTSLHTGEAQLRDGDYYGSTVNRAARLRSLARGRQVLMSQATSNLVADARPPDTALVDLGERALTGLSRPERVFELVLPGAAPAPPDPPPEPTVAPDRPGSAALEEGRAALSRRDWHDAFGSFSAADTVTTMGPEDLEGLAEAAFWTGHYKEAISARQRAHAEWLRLGNRPGAAGAAIALVLQYACRGNMALASGWLSKAKRLLDGEPEGPPHGYLSLMMTLVLLGSGDVPGALEAARSTYEIGERFNDSDLQALGLTFQGYALARQGRISEATPLFDEAMATAATGELGPLATSLVYCRTICACLDVFDYRRAAEWTEAAGDCPTRTGMVEYLGSDCRTHRADLLLLHGQWAEGEAEARRACDELEDIDLGHVGQAWYEIGEIRRRMDDVSGAEAAFGRTHELGRTPQPGLALLRLRTGETNAALASITAALADESLDDPGRARLLPALVEISLAAGATDTARAAADDLRHIADKYPTTALKAASECAGGAVALAEKDHARAINALRRGRQLWRELEAPYEEARTRVLLGRALHAEGDLETCNLELRAAQSSFERLGAGSAAEETAQLLDALS